MTENRAAIIALHRAGKSNSDIANTFNWEIDCLENTKAV